MRIKMRIVGLRTPAIPIITFGRITRQNYMQKSIFLQITTICLC